LCIKRDALRSPAAPFGEIGKELEGLCRQSVGAAAPLGAGGKQFGIVRADRSGAGPRRNDDGVVPFERRDRTLSHRGRAAMIAEIERRLAAAGLIAGDVHHAAGVLQQGYRGEAHAGPHRINQTGDEQSYARRGRMGRRHSFLPSPRGRERLILV